MCGPGSDESRTGRLDAVCSRRPANLEIGLGQARQAGAVVTATETVVSQLLGSADSDAVRELSKLLR